MSYFERARIRDVALLGSEEPRPVEGASHDSFGWLRGGAYVYVSRLEQSQHLLRLLEEIISGGVRSLAGDTTA
ncbi:MAG: hypothetical protein V3S51_01485 [Dehalococcoidia bacterium]